MTNSNFDISKEEYQNRIKIYDFYLEIKEEIMGKKVEIESNDYEELIYRTEISTILNYIKQSIPILINKKIEEYEKKNSKSKEIIKLNNINNDFYLYENQLRKLENEIRFYIKQNLIYKIQKDSFERTLRNYMEMEIEFEELKDKLKYDGGEFLQNDRKENEIEILRRENCNLKNEIEKIEKEKKLNENIILNLKNEIEKLNKTISNINEYNTISITSSMKNKNNKVKNIKSLNLSVKQNINSSFRNKKTKNSKQHNNSMSYDLKSPKNLSHDNKKKNQSIENDIFTQTYYKVFGSSNKSNNKKQKNFLRNNSMNNIDDHKKIDIVKKYFCNGICYNNKNNNNNNNNNYYNKSNSKNNNYSFLRYNKITNAIPSSKFCLKKEKNNFSLSNITISHSKKNNKSGNSSLINTKSGSMFFN